VDPAEIPSFNLTQVIQINPQDAEASLNRGLACWAKGETDRAIADFSKAIDINPQHANALLSRAIADHKKAMQIGLP
jgi:tetratricopeptide (TPR) repeat protein